MNQGRKRAGKIEESRTNNEMVTKKTWKEFRETGLVLIINQILHIFGWAIVFEFDENCVIKKIYPARVKFRGFSNDVVSKSYLKASQWIHDNADTLLGEAKDE